MRNSSMDLIEGDSCHPEQVCAYFRVLIPVVAARTALNATGIMTCLLWPQLPIFPSSLPGTPPRPNLPRETARLSITATGSLG